MPHAPHHPSAEFSSALPEMVKFKSKPDKEKSKKDVLEKRREISPQEKAILLWDTYQDIKTAWANFVRSGREKRKATREMADVSSEDEAPAVFEINLFDTNNPLSQEFYATPQFKKLHPQLQELWSDETTQEAWRGQMRRSAEQWADVNGSYEDYLETSRRIEELQTARDVLLKEKFDERGKEPSKRRRTLKDDMADSEMALAEERIKAEALSKKSPELAAKILANEFKKRRAEWRGKDRFMWTPSRRRVLEQILDIVKNQETLRPIILEGEAGTGKTTLADAVARFLTGQDALRATVKQKTKAGRELLSDQILESAGSPTVYQVVLEAITGKKRPTDAKPAHQGLVAFIDEWNRMANDEAGELATMADGARVGGKTRYAGLGANPDDIVQRKALVLGAQNPAGERFQRTDFTPEVKRKMTMVEVPYPPQTPDDPELYEDFLVVLQNAEGNIVAESSEVSPSWTDPKDRPDGTKQAELETNHGKGGALWRLTQMLHESYENLAVRPDRPRKNVLTDENPDALLAGRVLPPGDVLNGLKNINNRLKKAFPWNIFCPANYWVGLILNSAAPEMPAIGSCIYAWRKSSNWR